MGVSELLEYMLKNKPRMGVVKQIATKDKKQIIFSLGHNILKLNEEQINSKRYSDEYKFKFEKSQDWICVQNHLGNVELTLQPNGGATIKIHNVSNFGQDIPINIEKTYEINKEDISRFANYLNNLNETGEIISDDFREFIFSKVEKALPDIISAVKIDENKKFNKYIEKYSENDYSD